MKLFQNFLCIEGNIGSGKTELLKLITKENENFDIINEPLDQWQNFCGQDLLKKSYEDPMKYAFIFQLLVTLTLSEELYNKLSKSEIDYEDKENNGETCSKRKRKNSEIVDKFCISERSLFSVVYCFLKLAKSRERVTELEYELLCKQVNHLIEVNGIPQYVLYLKCDPETCLERIKLRNRTGEDNITLDYLKEIDKEHEIMIKTLNEKYNIKVVTIDVNKLTSLQVYKEIKSTMKW